MPEPEFKFVQNENLEKKDYVVDQEYEKLTAEEHDRWRRLYRRQMKILRGRAVPEFFENIEILKIAENGIPNYDELSDRLEDVTGWRLVPVPGLVPDDVFFKHLANRRFPATNWIRSEEQMDYIVEPDAFHDVFAHVPMIADEFFADYLQQYGEEGLEALKRGTLKNVARVYWYTVEFGLFKTDKGLRIYGAGIQSSKTESIYSLESPKPRRVFFDVDRVMRTDYIIYTFQPTYFVIDSYDTLIEQTSPDVLREKYDEILADPLEFEPDKPVPGDKEIPPNPPTEMFRHFFSTQE